MQKIICHSQRYRRKHLLAALCRVNSAEAETTRPTVSIQISVVGWIVLAKSEVDPTKMGSSQ